MRAAALASAAVALALAACGGPAPSPPARPSPSPLPLVAGGCTRSATPAATAASTSGARFTVGIPAGWEDQSPGHSPRFLVWLQRQGSQSDSLRIADVTSSGHRDADSGATAARAADSAAGAKVGPLAHCTIAGERAALYTAAYPGLPPALLILVAHGGHLLQIEVDWTPADEAAVSSAAQAVLGSWKWI